MKGVRHIVSICLFFIAAQSLAQTNERTIEELLKLSSIKMGNDSVESLPIIYQRNSLIFLDVVINGKEYRFLFDTGASACMVSKEIAGQSITQSVTTLNDGFEKESKVDVVLQNFQIGNTTFNNIFCVVGDTKTLSDLGCVEIDGVIGMNIINLLNWQIDPERKRLSFSRAPFKTKVENLAGMQIAYTDNSLPLLQLNYDGIAFYCLIDFGYNGHLDVNKGILEKSKKLKKVNRIIGSGMYALSVNSKMEAKVYRTLIDKINADDIVFHDVPTTLTTNKPKLGSAILKRYLVTLNSTERRLFLMPLMAYDTSSLSYPVTFMLNDSNELVIGFVWETDQTKRSGLKVGQKVISIDGQTVERLNNLQLCTLKNTINQRQSIKIVVDISKEYKEVELSKVIL